MKKYLNIDLKLLDLEKISKINTDLLIVGCYKGNSSGKIVKILDQASHGAIKKITKRGDHKGLIGKSLSKISISSPCTLIVMLKSPLGFT